MGKSCGVGSGFRKTSQGVFKVRQQSTARKRGPIKDSRKGMTIEAIHRAINAEGRKKGRR
jgi:hypothetical protein